MPRYIPIHKRSEEEKRNFKVDPKRISEWEVEIESIRLNFRKFNLNMISAAATLIYEMYDKLSLFEFHQDSKSNREKLENWKKFLTVDSLICLTDGYSAPYFLRSGKYNSIIEKIRFNIEHIDRQLAESIAKGVTNSLWISVLTSKIDINIVKQLELQKKNYLVLSREIPNIVNAIQLLTQVHSESFLFAKRLSQIQDRLHLAKEKRGAIERFEAKHGNAFAKAAVVDNRTRTRATSLKRLVEKTLYCPYCSGELGANPHLDHIYPVSKGGLSIVENLIWCCSVCNSVKADKGLMRFIKERGLSVEKILSKLHTLEKHV